MQRKNTLSVSDFIPRPGMPTIPYSTLMRFGAKASIWAWMSALANMQLTTTLKSTIGQEELSPLPGEHAKRFAQLLVLHSQFRLFVEITNETTQEIEAILAYKQDIEALEKCPIILASNLAHAKDETSFTTDRIYPPIEHGTIGLVMPTKGWDDVREWCHYNISELPKEAQKRQIHISQRLEELERDSVHTARLGPLATPFFNDDMEVKAMIQQLAQDYYQYHLQQPQEGIQKRPLTIDPSLPSGDMYSSSCFPMMAVSTGIWGGASGKKKGWKKSRGQGPQYELSSKDGTSYTAMEYNTTTRETAIDDALAKELWNQLDQYRDHDVDAFAIAIAYAARVNGQSFWVFGDDILDHRDKMPRMQRDAPDKEKRPAGQRKEKIIPYGESFGRLSNTWVNIRQVVNEPEYDKKSKRRKQRVFTHSGRLLMVEQVWYQKEFDPDTGETINGHVVGWKIRVGEWLQTYLEFPNEQIALLSKKILNYDPHNNPWEKRLGYYFFVHGHISNPKGGSATFNREIEDLLDTVSLDIDARFPQRTRDRFEKAMNKLKEDNVISDWHYKGKLNLPSKRWQEQWLKSMVTIHIAPRKVLP